MFNSRKYWNNRYDTGGNSGNGSYNNLAQFKSEVINDFIENNNINTVIDYGVGDGNQLKYINMENKKYIGIDISPRIIERCKDIFSKDDTKSFILDNDITDDIKGDLVLSCDVIYHLIEDNVYNNYMKNLFNMSKKYVIIYAKNEDINHVEHVRFRKFSNYIENKLENWDLIRYIPNKYPQLKLGEDNDTTSPSDFYIYEKKNNLQILNEKTEYNNLIESWKKYINNNLLPIIKELNIKLEGNIYTSHNTYIEHKELTDKQNNIYNLLNKIKPKKILEIGFNAGFSCLLMKMVFPDVNITCVDINSHKYVLPCFNRLKEDYDDLSLIPESSYDIALPRLVKANEKYDIIHIDGDHSYEGAKKDLELSLQLCNIGSIIIFDDTNMKHLNNLCDEYINKGLVCEYNINLFKNTQNYKHRFLKVISDINGISLPLKLPLQLPVYISLTSIFNNQLLLLKVLISILKQTRTPDKIFLYLSTEPYLMDKGFNSKKKIHNRLLKLLLKYKSLIEITWVENTGSYRKLLPLLKEKWDEDCIIITIDDDTIYHPKLIENLIRDYNKYKCVINYRGFTPKFDKLENFNYHNRYDKPINDSLYNFPTGKGSILYKPEFFHKTRELIFNKDIYMNECKTTDDIWFYILRIKNNINCYINDHIPYMTEDITNLKLALSVHCNHEDNNTITFKKTLNKLNKLNELHELKKNE